MNESLKKKLGRCKALLWGLLLAAGILVSALTIAGFASGLWWPFELACHFRVQYFLSLLIIELLLALAGKWRFAAALGVFSLANLAVIVPLFVADAPAGGRGSRTFRVLHCNVRTSNPNCERMAAVIARYDPDIVLLEEVNRRWITLLGDLRRTHPHSTVRLRGDNFGIALFSRLPLKDARVVQVGAAGVPSVVAEIETPDGAFTFFGTHPVPPMGRSLSAERNEQLAAIPAFLETVRQPVVLVGDLNITPWSAHFRRLLRDAGLRDSTRGHGFQPTWPGRAFWFWIPIDHCLYSRGIEIVDRQVGPDIGSDHYPLIVDFRVGAPKERGVK